VLTNYDNDFNFLRTYVFIWAKEYGWMLLPIVQLFRIGQNFTEEMIEGIPHESQTSDGELHNAMSLVSGEFTKKKEASAIHKICATSLTIVEMIVKLLNCKNIIAVKNNPPSKLNQKRKRSGKLPLFSYYTLRINPSDEDDRDNKSQTLNHNRIHLCRGHFKRYTKENPLFGKISGLWWWQPHVRGQNKDGVVIKDYKLDTTKEVSHG